MTVRGIHHLGVAVADLDEALATYSALFGARVEHRSTVPDQGVDAMSLLVGAESMSTIFGCMNHSQAAAPASLDDWVAGNPTTITPLSTKVG